MPTIDDCLAMLLDAWNFGRFFSSSKAVGSMASTRLVLLSDFPFTTIFLLLPLPYFRETTIFLAFDRSHLLWLTARPERLQLPYKADYEEA